MSKLKDMVRADKQPKVQVKESIEVKPSIKQNPDQAGAGNKQPAKSPEKTPGPSR